MTTSFIVITEVPEPPDVGNLAALGPCWAQVDQPSAENNYLPVVKPLHEVDPNLAMAALLVLRVPVFVLGEIILVDDSGREIGGNMRKPSKWDISYEEFDLSVDAVARSREVTKVGGL